jgi:hypothetical protein
MTKANSFLKMPFQRQSWEGSTIKDYFIPMTPDAKTINHIDIS